MATTIILVRHAETDWNNQKRIQGGASDIPLNAYGIKQAEGIAKRLEGEKLKAIFSSPLDRAMTTAGLIASKHSLQIMSEPNLREIEAGELEGITFTKLGKKFSQVLVNGAPDEKLPKLPGGESLFELQKRSFKIIENILTEYEGETTVVVTHYFVILAIICAVLKLPLTNIGSFQLNTASIQRLEQKEGWLRLAGYNESF